MRGKATPTPPKLRIARITPAYAGKSPLSDHIQNQAWDHPRLCGEKLLLCEHCGKPIGSPPPMRGKETKMKNYNLSSRITPAYAGKRQKSSIRISAYRDHPRLCGEKFCNNQFGRSIQGSPPPMRGKVRWQTGLLPRSGITPAYAGKSVPIVIKTLDKRDHPRLCGEKIYTLHQTPLIAGSPPPMRGKAIAAFPKHHASRITPAYAGKSGIVFNIQIDTKDHPRLCGEKLTQGSKIITLGGSPPPMRGKGYSSSACFSVNRITPAYAGKRFKHRSAKIWI